MQEGPETCRDNERERDIHTQGMSRAHVRAAAGGVGEKEEQEGQG